MNKFFKKAAILTFGLGVAMSFTACHSGEGESLPTEKITTTDGVTYTLGVNVNVSTATVTFGDGSIKPAKKVTLADGTTDYFFDIPEASKGDNLKVSASGMKGGYNGTVKFGDDKFKYLVVQLFADPLADASYPKQGKGTGDVDLNNSNANQSDNDGTVVNLTVPAGSDNPTSGDDEDFSIYLYTPTNESSEELVNKSDEANISVLAIACTPDGADWRDKTDETQWPKVTARLEASSQLNVKLVNSEDKADVRPLMWENASDPDLTSVFIPHFSSWYYMLNATVVDVNEEEEVLYTNPQRYVTNGKKTSIKYTRNLGVAVAEAKLPLLIKKYIQILFGNGTTINSTYNYTPTMSGIASESIKQVKKTLTIESKNPNAQNPYRFKVTVWGAIKPEIIIYAKTHSGGANE